MSASGVAILEAQPQDLDLAGVAARMAPYQAQVDELLRRYPVKRAALLQMLWLVQGEFGWVPRVAMKWAAKICEVSPVHAFSVVEFYTMYRQLPWGRFTFRVCHNMACHIQGAEELIAHLEKRLSIHAGETTPDGLFSIERVECIAACGNGPAVQINDDFLFGPDGLNQLQEGWHPTPEIMDEWIERLRAKAAAEPQPPRSDEVGGIVLETAGHPGAAGARAQVQASGYAKPPPPLRVTVKASDDGRSAAVSWLAAPECVDTLCEVSTDGGSNWQQIGNIVPAKVPGPPGPKTCSVEDAHGAAVGTQRSYRIWSVLGDGQRRASVVVEHTVPAAQPAGQEGGQP
ncbi:MAG: NAD(P)H-dependent oxidoreductase subunit E [Planctomycetota bacterium]|nr:MAG: NAD(P)H-dependent oxidoreductase subunit E [Planctomycetota bacterium]